MNPLSLESMLEMRGNPVVDRDGEEVGSISEVYVDRDTRLPEWVGVTRNFWGGSLVLVPLFEADATGGVLRVPYERRTIEETPTTDAGELDESTERRLYEHYGISYSEHTSSSGLPSGVDVSTGDHEYVPAPAPHTATRWSWPDEPAATPMAGTPERLADESRVDTHGVTAQETMAPNPRIEPEAATSPDNAPGLRAFSQQSATHDADRGLRPGPRAIDREALVMSSKPSDLPGTLYDTSPDGMKGSGARKSSRARNTAITMSALGAGLLFLRRMRRRRIAENRQQTTENRGRNREP
jgi:hypothetical protein